MQPGDIASMVAALAWPLAALVIAVILRAPLVELLSNIGARATKLSVLQISVELAAVPEVRPQWSIDVGPRSEDLRRLTPADVLDSYAMTLFERLNDPTAFDYVVVDLEDGHSWLTSRLFLFAVLLERMRGLRCFVFIHTEGERTRRFVGIARPEEVRWALAMRYPWLEAAWARAYANPIGAYGQPIEQITATLIRSPLGTLDHLVARDIGQQFLMLIQRAQPPDPADEHRWVRHDRPPPSPTLWELGSWMTGTSVERDLGEALDTAAAIRGPASWEPAERVRAVLAQGSPFVALLDEDGRFHPRAQTLVDRTALLDAIEAQQGA